jgi:integrase
VGSVSLGFGPTGSGSAARSWARPSSPVTSTGFDPGSAGEDRFAIYVWRSDGEGSDTKTEKSRRTLVLPRRCVEALRTPLRVKNVIWPFRTITKKAGLREDWTPRELRQTFVSVVSANGVPVENIALLVGHDRTATTESVYRHEIRPALTQGAEVMDRIFA